MIPRPRGKNDHLLPTVQKKLAKLGYQKTADLIGLPLSTLRKQINTWKRQGHKLPDMTKTVEIGTITERKDGNVVYQFEKTAKGWKRLKRITPYKDYAIDRKPPKERPQKLMAYPKPIIKQLPTKAVDESQYRSVRVDARTVIRVKNDVSDSDAIAGWRKKYKNPA